MLRDPFPYPVLGPDSRRGRLRDVNPNHPVMPVGTAPAPVPAPLPVGIGLDSDACATPSPGGGSGELPPTPGGVFGCHRASRRGDPSSDLQLASPVGDSYRSPGAEPPCPRLTHPLPKEPAWLAGCPLRTAPSTPLRCWGPEPSAAGSVSPSLLTSDAGHHGGSSPGCQPQVAKSPSKSRALVRNPQPEPTYSQVGHSSASFEGLRTAGQTPQWPRSIITWRSTAGRSVMMPSTPMSSRRRISAGSSMVHTWTAMPWRWAAATTPGRTSVNPFERTGDLGRVEVERARSREAGRRGQEAGDAAGAGADAQRVADAIADLPGAAVGERADADPLDGVVALEHID